MRLATWMLGSALALAAFWACSEEDPPFTADDGGADADTDGDTDSDTDSDTDTGEDELPPELPAACTAESVGVPLSGAGDGRWPAVAGSASGVLMAWAYDEQEGLADWDIQIATHEPGIPPVIGAAQEPIATATLSEKPALAVRGGTFGLAWLDTRWDAGCQVENQGACQREVAFLELDAAGLPANDGELLRVTTGQNQTGRPVIAPTASGWIIAWAQNQGSMAATVKAVAIDGAGQPGAVHAVSGEGAAAPDLRPALAALGDQALIAWLAADRAAVFSRVVGADGTPQGAPAPAVEGGPCSGPDLAAGDDGFLLTYGRSKGADLEIRALRLDTAGVPVGDEQRVTWTSTDTVAAASAWNGSEWAVAWLSDRANGAEECQVASCQPQVFLTALDADGAPRSREVALSDDQNFAAEPDLAWDGLGWLGVFELLRNLRRQIHWAHAFCD